MNDKDMQRLRHILEESDDIIAFVAEGSKDKKTIKAVVRSIEIIGEAVSKLSMELKALHPHVPWQDIADMRNLIAHEYFRVDELLVWQVATVEVPQLKHNIHTILQSMKG